MSAISSKVAPWASSLVASVCRNRWVPAFFTLDFLNTANIVLSAIPITALLDVTPFQKKYGQSSPAPRGGGSASSANFTSSGIIRYIGLPFFWRRRSTFQEFRSPSHATRDFSSVATSLIASPVNR